MKTFSPPRPARVVSPFRAGLAAVLPRSVLAALCGVLLAAAPPGARAAAPAAEPPTRGIRVVGVQQAGQSTAGNAGLFVGVNEFEDDSIPALRFAVNDAVAQAHLFVLELQLVPAENATLLLSGEPGTETARAQKAALARAGVRLGRAVRPQILRELARTARLPRDKADLMLVSLSSHGFEQGGVPYIMPGDGLKSFLRDTGVPLPTVKEQLGKSDAGKRLLIVDACREKTAVDGKNLGTGMNAVWRAALAEARGQAVLASCDVGQFSFEDEKLGHGVFTHHLLGGLRGGAKADERGFITLGTLSEYVARSVDDWVRRNKVGSDADGAQKPWFEGPIEAGTIPLAVKVAGLPPEAVPSVPPPAPTPPPPVVTGPATATKANPWENSLGMKFVPVAGTPVLFGVWHVRVQDYQAFATATGRAWEKPSFAQGPTHPAMDVSWDDAQAFCQWLTQKERDEGKLTRSQSYRLPADWEWSVAAGLNKAKAGNFKFSTSSPQVDFKFSTSSPQVDGFKYTYPVGSFAANQYGLYDMGGNAWQWCENFSSGGGVLRGGSWSGSAPGNPRSSESGGRNYVYDSNVRGGNNGFRLVLVVGALP